MLQNLLEQLKNAGTGSKVIAGLVVVALVGIIATAGVVAQRPHFELLYSELSASESAKIQKALAGAGIPFEQSQPPGPFMIYVDDADRYKAMHAVAASGALDRTPGGILPTDGGMGSVFMSANERNQVTLKRQWQELESQLEVFDFVTKATVTTTTGERSAFGRTTPRTGSVMLQLRGVETLTREQAQSVASQVRFSLGIESQHLTIADQRGRSLFDGGSEDEMGGGKWLEQKTDFEHDLEERANSVLAAVLGPDRARVTVTSTWNQDLTSKFTETADPKSKIVISERTESSQTASGASGVGGAAGPGTNAGDFGVDSAGVPDGSGGSGSDQATSENAQKTYYTPRGTSRTVRVNPVLERLSVSLFLDQRMFDDDPDFESKKRQLEDSVKAAVGFDDTRTDSFSSVTLPFHVPEVPEAEAEGEAEEPPAPPNPMLEMLLERGVEIVSALAFLFLLMKAMKSAPPTVAATADEDGTGAVAADGDPEDVMELLAQAQIEELVKSDPARVGQILASWASEEKAGAGS